MAQNRYQISGAYVRMYVRLQKPCATAALIRVIENQSNGKVVLRQRHQTIRGKWHDLVSELTISCGWVKKSFRSCGKREKGESSTKGAHYTIIQTSLYFSLFPLRSFAIAARLRKDREKKDRERERERKARKSLADWTLQGKLRVPLQASH